MHGRRGADADADVLRALASPSRGRGPVLLRQDLTARRRRGPDAKGVALAASHADDDGDADAGTGGRRRHPGGPAGRPAGA